MRQIYLSFHVLFDEESFLFQDLTSSEGGVSATGIQSHPNVLFSFPTLTNSICSLLNNSLPTNIVISLNTDLVEPYLVLAFNRTRINATQ